MTAYQELKNDPKDGATIVLFSWMTKFLMIFLEIVPIVAKMFFSPPSVYAARIQATVNRGREEAFRLPLALAPQMVLESEPRAPRSDVAQRLRTLEDRPELKAYRNTDNSGEKLHGPAASCELPRGHAQQ
jgi:hypothetical protein